jgi:hypothetical protein
VSTSFRTFLGLSLAAPLAVAALAAQQGQPVNVDTLGPQPGQKAIGFQLPDQNGRPRDLASVAGPKGTMLVFFRSADW